MQWAQAAKCPMHRSECASSAEYFRMEWREQIWGSAGLWGPYPDRGLSSVIFMVLRLAEQGKVGIPRERAQVHC